MRELTKPLDGRPVTPLHAANVRRILERCRDEAGISDLKADDVAELTADWIRNLCCRYKGTVSDKIAGPKTRRHTIVTLKGLGEWAHAKSKYKLPRNPFAEIKTHDVEMVAREPYSIDDLRLILSNKNAFHPAYMIAVLAIYAGLRANDIRSADWDWIDWKRNWIVVPAEVSKTRKTRLVHIQPELFDILSARREESGPIVFMDWGKNATAKASKAVLTLLERVGIKRGGRVVHDLRHACGSLLHATREDSAIIKETLGHATQEMSDFYGGCAKYYKQQVEAEKWPRGEFFLRRKPPAALSLTTAQAAVNA